jgi:hypothetical protein
MHHDISRMVPVSPCCRDIFGTESSGHFKSCHSHQHTQQDAGHHMSSERYKWKPWPSHIPQRRACPCLARTGGAWGCHSGGQLAAPGRLNWVSLPAGMLQLSVGPQDSAAEQEANCTLCSTVRAQQCNTVLLLPCSGVTRHTVGLQRALVQAVVTSWAFCQHRLGHTSGRETCTAGKKYSGLLGSRDGLSGAVPSTPLATQPANAGCAFPSAPYILCVCLSHPNHEEGPGGPLRTAAVASNHWVWGQPRPMARPVQTQ